MTSSEPVSREGQLLSAARMVMQHGKFIISKRLGGQNYGRYRLGKLELIVEYDSYILTDMSRVDGYGCPVLWHKIERTVLFPEVAAHRSWVYRTAVEFLGEPTKSGKSIPVRAVWHEWEGLDDQDRFTNPTLGAFLDWCDENDIDYWTINPWGGWPGNSKPILRIAVRDTNVG